MGVGKVKSKSQCRPNDWLLKWKDFENSYSNTYKIFNKDRSDYSRSEAFATLINKRFTDYKVTGTVNDDDFKLKFKHVSVTNHPHAIVESQEIKVVEGSKIKENPYKRSQECIDSSYCDISDKSPTKLIGKAPSKTGAVPWKTRWSNFSEASAYWSDTIDEKYKGSGLYNTFVLTGGWAATQRILREFSSHPLNIPVSYNRQNKYINRLESKCGKIPTFSKVQTSEMMLQKIRMPSKPGGDWDNVFPTKRNAINTAYLAARKQMLAAYKSPTVNLSYYTSGGKAKPQFDKEYDSEIYSRLTWQQDIVEFLIAKPYVDKIEQFFFRNHKCPIKIGKNITHNRTINLIGDFLTYKWGISADYKLFDSSLVRDKIVAAFAFCRSFFEESVEIDNLFIYMCDGFINKYLLAPDGKMFKVSSGTPSGNAWTTIINSIANALILEEILDKYGPFTNREGYYIVAGDDCCLLFDKEIAFSEEKFIRFIKRKFDMNIEITQKGNTISHDPEQSLDFNKLCYYWDNGMAVPTTKPSLLFKKLIASEYNRASVVKAFDRIEGQASRLLTHPDCVNMLATFQASILHKVGSVKFYDSYTQFSRYIRNQVEKVYFGEKPITLGELTDYAGDKEFILYLLDGSCRPQLAYNWLKDNTVFYNGYKIQKENRFEWLQTQMGTRTQISIMWKNLSKLWLPLSWTLKQKFDKVRECINNALYWGDFQFL